jgi:hypothetical protein
VILEQVAELQVLAEDIEGRVPAEAHGVGAL